MADLRKGVLMLSFMWCSCHVALSQTPNPGGNEVDQEMVTVADNVSMESKVLGPLRVWHIVFLVSSFLLIIMIIVCCCCDFRIPRTRQEIEESYKKRVDNANYIKYLDKLPQNILKSRTAAGLTERSKTTDAEDHPKTVRPSRTSKVEDSAPVMGPKTKITKGGQVAVETPLASHVGVMAAMSRMRHNARSRPKQTGMAKSMTSLPMNKVDEETG